MQYFSFYYYLMVWTTGEQFLLFVTNLYLKIMCIPSGKNLA